MMNPSIPPFPLNKPYHWSFNYFEYVKNCDLDVHVKVFKATIKVIGEIKDA
jgi:hypothetical protein